MNDTSLESPIRVCLLLQNRLLRDALERLLRKRVDLQVVACLRGEECTADAIANSQCDVLVLDFLETRWLPTEIESSTGNPSPKSLLVCMDDDPEQFTAAIQGGAIGYLLKEASIADVLSAIRAISRSEAVCPPKLCAELFRSLRVERLRAGNQHTRPPLTLRQRRLAGLVAKGLSNKEIANQLNVSEFTVKNHLYRIMKRFGAKNRTQAVDAIATHGYSLANIQRDASQRR